MALMAVTKNMDMKSVLLVFSINWTSASYGRRKKMGTKYSTFGVKIRQSKSKVPLHPHLELTRQFDPMLYMTASGSVTDYTKGRSYEIRASNLFYSPVHLRILALFLLESLSYKASKSPSSRTQNHELNRQLIGRYVAKQRFLITLYIFLQQNSRNSWKL